MHRPRILRSSPAIRSLVQESSLSVNDFMVPLFVVEGKGVKEEISSMPGYYRFSLDVLRDEVREISDLGLKSVLLFVKVDDSLKDNSGTEALNPDGLMQRAIRTVKEVNPNLLVLTDVALDPFSSYGHDGIVEDGKILNDATVEVLQQMAVSHIAAGADWVAPSDMMDGRIGAIRLAFEEAGYHDAGIMAYSAKYASCFYGPFRDALDSAPGFGDKKTYQMNPANIREGLKEAMLDQEEGADMLMVKPAVAYLDVIKTIKDELLLPVSAYHVSGEYAMIKAAAEKGWLNENQAILETLTSIKRAGADVIATYFAKDAARLLNS
ncbi:porphobilinogen synthase [Phaeocystidibacter luteus]|uniref:Delta-aminolevulinic acid dehydratase n=1 Tax=Phaeocystidibacter luteus TaxID=911197 RepID=A0A6N6REM6_9FLAO|nr:porphobilinogen synthase [Phaeocystidibacter luteus]KAB2807062.1 porphobilinogen synthase [Phaeocystidibacter luteus]